MTPDPEPPSRNGRSPVDEADADGSGAEDEDPPEVVVSDRELAEEDLPDATLGGYFEHHDRPPAFEGPDGEPYTVSPEVEKTGDLAAPYHGYLVFPRWAATGLGVVDHVESPTLIRARTPEEARKRLGELPLREVKEHLDRAVTRSGPGGADAEDTRAP